MAVGIFSAGAAALCGAFSTAAATIGSVCGSIGGTIMTTVGSLGAGLLKLGEMVKPIFEVINKICTVMGIKPAGEDPMELALKAEKSGEKPEDYDSVEAYIEHLRKDIELDKEEINKLTDSEKVMYSAIGCGLYVKNVEERYNMAVTPGFLVSASKAVNSGAMTGEQMKNTMDAMKERGVKNAESFSNYMDGKANMEEQMVMYDSLKEALHREFPDLSEAELNIKTSHIKDFVADK